MSNLHLRQAWLVPRDGPTGVSAPTKLVLLALADHACEECGLAWPGRRLLGQKTLLGPTRIGKAVDELLAVGLVVVHAYPKGGRGRSTEFVVLPGLKLSPPPCPRCLEAQKPKPTAPR